MCYYPFSARLAAPGPFACYAVPQTDFADEPGDLIVVPETFTGIIAAVRRARCAVWWLSVDNYFKRRGESRIADAWQRALTLFGERLPLRRMQHVEHWAQSFYAWNFLARYGIASAMLSDYLSDVHFCAEKGQSRRAAVAFNPRKGVARTRALMKACPNIEFIPIEGVDAAGVRRLLQNVSIYIDFGHHPGKDRLPREAAMAGCCVITGRRGSAGNAVDVAVPQRYKLDDQRNVSSYDFQDLVNSIFADFEKHQRDFVEYREGIMRERAVFEAQLDRLFGPGTCKMQLEKSSSRCG